VTEPGDVASSGLTQAARQPTAPRSNSGGASSAVTAAASLG